MSRLLTETLCLKIDRHGVSLEGAHGRLNYAPAEQPLISGKLPEAILACLKTGARKPRRAIAVQFSDALSRYWMVKPPGNAASLRDLRAAAQWQFESLFAEPADTWVLRVDWQATRPLLACAAPRLLCDQIKRACTLAHVRILRCTSNFVSQWNANCIALRNFEGWFVACDDDVATIARVARGHPLHVQSIVCSTAAHMAPPALVCALKCLMVQFPGKLPHEIMLACDAPMPDIESNDAMFLWRTVRRGIRSAPFASNVSPTDREAR